MRKLMVGLFPGVLAVPASASIVITDYDLNKNDQIEQEEFEKFILDFYGPPLSTFDISTDENSAAEPTIQELKKQVEKLKKLNEFVEKLKGSDQVDSCVNGGFIDEFGKSPKEIAENGLYNKNNPCQFDQSDIAILRSAHKQPDSAFDQVTIPNTFDQEPELGWQKTFLRGAHENISILDTPKNVRSAKSAELSFSRDSAADNEAWVVKGALMKPYLWSESMVLAPGLEMNQVRNSSDSKTDTDSLVFGVGFEKEFKTEDLSWLRGGIQYATDTDLDLDVRGVELHYEPFDLDWPGRGTANKLGSLPLSYKWAAVLSSEFGRVYDVGTNTSLVTGEDYLRFGASLELNLWPTNFKKYEAQFAYTYLDTVSGDLRDRKHFSAAFSYEINSNYKLQLKYSDGDTTIALEDEDTVTLGLGIKF